MSDTLLENFSERIGEQVFLSPLEGNVHVLHIEDNVAFADLVATYLKRVNDSFAITTETDPQDALDRLEELDVDCVVSDYDMPGLNGLDVLEEIRQQQPDLPFILFTGKGSEEIASKAISRGVTEYLQKGSGTEQYGVLANRIEQTVARYRAEQQVTRGFEAIEAAHDGIGLLDTNGEFIYVNQPYADITGYDREELIGESWDVLYPEEGVDDVYEEVIPEAREDGWVGRTTYLRKDGDPTTVEHRLTYTDEGTMICTISDVTRAEQVQAELSLKERAMDEAPIGIVITDPERDDNPIIYANDEFVELTGYPHEEVVGRNCRFLQGPETREEPVSELRTAVENHEAVVVELRNYRKDGELFWNRVSIAPIFENDELDYFVGFQQNVTAQRELQAQHEQFME